MQTDLTRNRVSFLMVINALYERRQYRQLQSTIIRMLQRILFLPVSSDMFRKLYLMMDPIYQMLYYDLKRNSLPVSRALKQILEEASIPWYTSTAEDWTKTLHHLKDLILKIKKSRIVLSSGILREEPPYTHCSRKGKLEHRMLKNI